MRTDSRTLLGVDIRPVWAGGAVEGGTADAGGGGVADPAGVVLGLPGFRVLAAGEVAGELEVVVETTAERTGCPGCGQVAVLHDRRPRWVRDLPIGGRPVLLVWSKRVWRCPDLGCPRLTWSETTSAVRGRAVLTERARVWACQRVGRDAISVAQLAADLGVGWGTVMRAVTEYGTRLLDATFLASATTTLGVDETAFLRATASRHTQYATGLVDLRPAGGGPARLLDVVEGRSGAVVSDWLADRDPGWTARITTAAIDPFRGYDTALRAGLPGATVVLDAFHAVKLAHGCLDAVRRRVQQDTLGHRGRRGDPLYQVRRVLLRGAETHTRTSWARMLAGLAAGDPDQHVGAAWIAAQELRHVYAAHDLPTATVRLGVFYRACQTPGVPELARLARTIRAWENQLLAYWTTGRVSNGPTEAVNLLIKRIKRVGFGFRNFTNYRLRLLLHCGTTWQHDRTPQIRARSPRMTT